MNITVDARSAEINKVVKFGGGPIDIGWTLTSLLRYFFYRNVC